MRRTPSHPAPVAAIILAAGKSRRMGSPKALLDYGGRTFLAQVLTQCAKAGFAPVIAVVGPGMDRQAGEARAHGAKVAVNPEPERGMLSSIVTGTDAVPPGCAGAAVMPVDLPSVAEDTYRRLLAAARTHPDRIVIPIHDRRRGHPVIFPRALFPALADAPPAEGARAVVWAHQALVLELQVADPGVTRDIDTPDEYLNLSTRTRSGRS